MPAKYVFEDDTCDNVVGPRCTKRDLKLKEEMEAAGSLGKDSAKSKREGPERGESSPRSAGDAEDPRGRKGHLRPGKNLKRGSRGLRR